MTKRFFELGQTDRPDTFRLQIDEPICVGPTGNAFMFGGVGLAAAVAAAEQVTGRNVVWANAQFVSYARIGDTLDLSVDVLSGGHNISQVRVLATTAGKPVVSVSAALGDRADQPVERWLSPPTDMASPDDCEPWYLWPKQDSSAALMNRIEARMTPGLYGAGPPTGERSLDGRSVFWVRNREGIPVDAAMLAVFGDFVPSGIGFAMGRRGGGNSLDNTLRVVSVVPTEWVLCDVRISAIARGFGHGSIYMFAEDGTLMATGSQSVIARFMQGGAGSNSQVGAAR